MNRFHIYIHSQEMASLGIRVPVDLQVIILLIVPSTLVNLQYNYSNYY